MNYKKYQASRDLAWRILLDEKICELPISVSKICRSLGIVIKYYNPPNNDDGCSFIINGTPTIFVNENISLNRKRFTAAHELGHILLGHTGRYKLVNREPGPNDNPIEQAANVFASRLLAPACVLWGCNVNSSADISKLCGISMQSAGFRMARMGELYKRDMFLTSPLEREVYAQFEEYIESHKL